MDNNPSEKETLLARINQLERERDDLQKDIEQLCIQQAGPSYVAVATRMHFQRTALLEQEIESLRKQLATSTRESQNLQEELTEAYRIKTQLADLHRAEAEKNTEAEKQVKFYQGCMAAAFAERDQSIMEAEKAKEQQELISQKFSGMEKRVDELNSDYLEQKRLNEELRIKLAKQENLNETFQKVINKFIEIRQQNIEGFEDASWDEKCACLLDDPAETWSYNDASVVKYISALESELETVRNSADNLRSKLRVGLEIENHLKRRVQDLEMKQILLSKMILNRISELHNYHSQHRAEIVSLLDEGRLQLKSAICMLESEVGHSDVQRVQDVGAQVDFNEDESECRDVHVNEDHSLESKTSDHKLPYSVVDGEDRPSEALALALQEKVATLLLLSQQEERHLLDRNVNVALQRKIEDLQRDLLQVTNEKVKVLMEFAQLKQEYQQLREQMGQDGKRETSLADTGIRRVFNNDSDGRLKNILKKTYLKRWVGFSEVHENKAEPHLHIEENSSRRRSNDLDLARMKIENATLKESLESMEHLTSSIHRLRLVLLKVKNSVTTEDTTMGINTLNDIVYEANLLKTALGSSLPLSWFSDMDEASITGQLSSDTNVVYKNPSSETVDPISAAGFEMVELIILAAQMLKDTGTHNGSSEAAD